MLADRYQESIGPYVIYVTSQVDGMVLVEMESTDKKVDPEPVIQVDAKQPGWRKQVKDALDEKRRLANLRIPRQAQEDYSLGFLREDATGG
jgi:hypothetical protein